MGGFFLLATLSTQPKSIIPPPKNNSKKNKNETTYTQFLPKSPREPFRFPTSDFASFGLQAPQPIQTPPKAKSAAPAAPSASAGQVQADPRLGYPKRFLFGRLNMLWVKTNVSGVGAPPILVYCSGDWDVHWGCGILNHTGAPESSRKYCQGKKAHSE